MAGHDLVAAREVSIMRKQGTRLVAGGGGARGIHLRFVWFCDAGRATAAAGGGHAMSIDLEKAARQIVERIFYEWLEVAIADGLILSSAKTLRLQWVGQE